MTLTVAVLATVSPASRALGRLLYPDIHQVAIYVGSGMVNHAPNSTETVRAQGIDLAPIFGYGRP